jgi:hypothetical protein
VTLDRVLNVYPDWERLTELSAQHAQRLYGLVYPRNTLMVRLVTFAMNVVLRLLRKPVRASVRPGEPSTWSLVSAVSCVTSPKVSDLPGR